MPPEYCPAHSDLMESQGAIKEGQKNMCEDLKEIKATLIRWEEESKAEAISQVEQKVRSKIIWVGVGTGAVAGISAAVHILIKKVLG